MTRPALVIRVKLVPMSRGRRKKGITVVKSPALQEFQVLKPSPKGGKTTLDDPCNSEK
jgi:hypothetical protein